MRRGPIDLALGIRTFLVYDPRVGMVIVGSGADAEVEGDGKIATSSACAVLSSLIDLVSIAGCAPESEFNDVHHSVPESFCMSAYFRLNMGI